MALHVPDRCGQFTVAEIGTRNTAFLYILGFERDCGKSTHINSRVGLAAINMRLGQ